VSDSRNDAWNGFADAFWTLGQVILWVVTRDRERVDAASDDVGLLGESYAEAAAAIQIDALAREDILDAAKEIRRRCAHGKLEALSAGQAIEAIKWTQLEIAFVDGVPFLRRVGQSGLTAAYPDVRFSSAAVLSEFESDGLDSQDGQDVDRKDDTKPCVEAPDPTTKAAPRKGKNRAQQRARKALDKLYPDRQWPLIDNKLLARAVNNELKREKQPEVSMRTVLRAMGRSKS
jgi:hypothetical protein